MRFHVGIFGVIHVPGHGHGILAGRAPEFVPGVDAPLVAPFKILEIFGIPKFPVSLFPEEDLFALPDCFWGEDADAVF